MTFSEVYITKNCCLETLNMIFKIYMKFTFNLYLIFDILKLEKYINFCSIIFGSLKPTRGKHETKLPQLIVPVCFRYNSEM